MFVLPTDSAAQVCATHNNMRAIALYTLDLETELERATATIKAINRQ